MKHKHHRPYLTAFLTCILLILSTCTAVASENQRLCTVDQSTGDEECKAPSRENHQDDDGAVELPVPTNADNDGQNEEHVYIDPYAVWDEEENEEEDDVDDPEEEEDEHHEMTHEDEDDDWSVCRDRHEDCPDLANDNECETNPGFMHFQCPESCDMCEDFYAAHVGEICTDNDASCKSWAASGECGFNPDYMHDECRRSCLRCFVDT